MGVTRALSRWAPPLALMGLIWALSAQPDLSSGIEGWDTVLRKGAHMAVFGALLLLWWRAIGPAPAVAVTFGWAVLDEWHQSWVEGRHGAVSDVAIDAAGMGVAAALAVWWLRDTLRDVEPTPDQVPIRVDKPWGHELWWAWTDQYVGKILHVRAGHRLSVQYHEHKDETSYVLSGRLTLLKGTSAEDLQPTEVAPGSQWRTRPGEVHTIEAIEDAEVLEVSTPHLDDVVRLTDSYGRAGTNSP